MFTADTGLHANTYHKLFNMYFSRSGMFTADCLESLTGEEIVYVALLISKLILL